MAVTASGVSSEARSMADTVAPIVMVSGSTESVVVVTKASF
jgi:hypothetical protein